jgi:ectoine hydroxylase-related dioxygenase (phytanoyl-CoA dioxygenase family)
MRRIFYGDDAENEITRNGFVVLKNFMPIDVCDGLNDFFVALGDTDPKAFSISNWHNDPAYRTSIYEKIAQAILPYSKEVLDNYKSVMGVFTAKRPGGNSDMLLHQDWSLVDETKFRSVSIWLALCDMDRSNGNLQVAPNSHIYAAAPRGINVPVPFENIRDHMLQNALTDIPIRKGDAIIFEHRLIHASPENQSEKLRLAAVLALIPEEADMLHYYKSPENEGELEILKLDPEAFFLLDFFDMANKPKHLSTVRKIPFSFRLLSIDDIEVV